MDRRSTLKLIGGSCLAGGLGALEYMGRWHEDWLEKRVKVVVAGRLVRGAWQRPRPLRRLIARERIRTILSLTAINAGDPKFRSQQEVVRETGVGWVIVPMRGSRATPEQMALAADFLADSLHQPVFFHCVAGHHRTSLAHAAYLIRHQGRTADEAWNEISGLAWSRPDSSVDRNDRFLIEEFARIERSLRPEPDRGLWEITHAVRPFPSRQAGRPRAAGDRGDLLPGPGLEPVDLQLRRLAARPDLPLRPDDGLRAGENRA